MKLVIINIKKLVQIEYSIKKKVCGKDMQTLDCIDDAYLIVEDGFIADFGKMHDIENKITADFEIIDATGRMVFPTFCDSHTHIVYAGSRELEFVDKIKGLSYEEIFRRGGGILNSARLLHETSEDELYASANMRLQEMISYGTGAVEIKSGYGLNLDDELKMLRVIKRLKKSSPAIIKATFLGAHAVPLQYKGRQSEYVELIVNEMIPKVAAEKLADFIDVFCDKGFFTEAETSRILEAGILHGLRPKIHANELDYSGGVQVGVSFNALSVDHLEYIGDDEISALLNSQTMPTVLPGAAFFLNLPLSPIRKMMESGLPIALASDFNPGSSPSGNMQFIASLACIRYKMLPEEAINALTINSAYAMNISDIAGSIAKGKIANFFITKSIASYEFLPYSFGSNGVESVFLKGNIVHKVTD